MIKHYFKLIYIIVYFAMYGVISVDEMGELKKGT